EFIKTDKAITEVVIGGKLRIRVANTYSNSLAVLVEQPFEEAKRFRMTAKLDGFDPKISYHEQRYEAEAAAGDLASKGAETAVEEITVRLNEDGEVVGDDVAPTSASTPEYEPAF